MMESPRSYAPHPRPIGLWPIQQQTDTSSVVASAAIEQIEEEETAVETVTSLLVADAAAEAAAQAEAYAESCAARTREARRHTAQAEAVLQQVMTLVESNVLSGATAQQALLEAEQDVVSAQEALTNAEAAEVRAREVAINAEAEAQVAEGMAFAAEAHSREIEQSQVLRSTLFNDLDTVEEIAADEEEMETLKLPGVRRMQAVQPGETA